MKNYEAIKQFIIDKLDKNLPNNLFYHGLHHTLNVLKSAEYIGKEEKISEEEWHC